MRQEEYKALVQAAREADLVAYFQQNGFTVERKGSEFYVKEYPSLCIKPSTNQWYFHYTREGATNNSINCLTRVLGMDFNQAVFSLTGQDISRMRAADFPRAQRPAMTTPPWMQRGVPEKKELHMPEQSEKTGRLFAYLCQTRKITRTSSRNCCTPVCSTRARTLCSASGTVSRKPFTTQMRFSCIAAATDRRENRSVFHIYIASLMLISSIRSLFSCI